MARSPPLYSELKDDLDSTPSPSPSPSLLSDEREDGDGDGGYEHEPPRPTRRRQWTTGRWVAVLISSLLFTNIATFLLTSHRVLSRDTCTEKHKMTVFEPPTGIAPFFRNISLELRPELVYAPFYDRSDSIYRKHNSPETERAWRELTQLDAGYILVPKEQAEEADIDPARHAYWDDAEKGLVGHPVRLEVTHQLHCVVSEPSL